MSTDQEQAPVADFAPPKMQFSLRTLLLLPVIAACVLSLFFGKPPNLIAMELALVTLILPAVLTTIVVYGQGYKRAFCIGALAPTGVLYLWSTYLLLTFTLYRGPVDDQIFPAFRWFYGLGWIAAIVSGFICMGFRWILERPAAQPDSKTRRGWFQLVFIVLLLLLLLSGPIIGQVGMRLGWWEAGTAASQNPTVTFYASPAPPPAPASTNPYATSYGTASSGMEGLPSISMPPPDGTP